MLPPNLTHAAGTERKWLSIALVFQLTPFCPELWRLFHPLMSEPNIPVHPNKQVLYSWFATT